MPYDLWVASSLTLLAMTAGRRAQAQPSLRAQRSNPAVARRAGPGVLCQPAASQRVATLCEGQPPDTRARAELASDAARPRGWIALMSFVNGSDAPSCLRFMDRRS